MVSVKICKSGGFVYIRASEIVLMVSDGGDMSI